MSTVHREAGINMARCRACDRDLEVRPPAGARLGDSAHGIVRRWPESTREVHVYCSNPGCDHYHEPHPTGNERNEGPK